MSLTKIDCSFIKKNSPEADSVRISTFNPERKPGSLVAVASLPARESIGGQVASKLALEHFIEGALDFFKEGRSLQESNYHADSAATYSFHAIEAAFRRANSSVYQFGHKLAAGGRMAASLAGLVISDNVASLGRVGSPAAYLYRASEFYPFFPSDSGDASSESVSRTSFVGSASLVSVELSSVMLEEADLIFLFPEVLENEELAGLADVLKSFRYFEEGACFEIIRRITESNLNLAFSLVVSVGPDTIYLEEDVAI